MQLLCFHLSELRGLARWGDRYTRLGLSEEGISDLIKECQELLKHVGDFRRAVDEGTYTSSSIPITLWFPGQLLTDCL